MRALTLVALVACSSGSTPAPDKKAQPATKPADGSIEVRVDRRVELLSIVHRLAGVSREYERAPATPYVAAIDRTFKPFANHHAIAATRELRTKHGIGWDAPMILAVHLDDHLQLRNAAELPALDKRFTGVDVETYAATLRDFAAASGLDAFLASQRDHLTKVETQLKTVVDKAKPVEWFDAYFGARPMTRYIVVPALLTGSANFGVRATLPDGTTELYQVLGVSSTDGLPNTDAEAVWLLVHEMAHSYINPLFEQHHAALEAAGAKLFPLVAQPMRAQAYKTWQIMLNESGVRALTVLYVREKQGDLAAAATIRSEIRNGFVWTNELAEVLQTFQRERATHKDFTAYMPQVIALFDRLALAYANGLPPMPFLGPLNTVYWRDPAFIMPETDLAPLTSYVARISYGFNLRSDRRINASRTLTDAHTGRDLVAYGTPASTAVIADVVTSAGWQITADAITLGARTFKGTDLVLIACWPKPGDPDRGIVVYTAHDERDLININDIHHGPQDWIVANKRLDGTFQVLGSGDFPHAPDGAWLLPQ